VPDDERAKFLSGSPERIEVVLRKLSDLVPYTWTIVIDQAEEILTLDHSAAGDEHRREFFHLVSLLTRSKFDFKMIISMRTEYYGRFFARSRIERGDVLKIRDYFLDELNVDQMRVAILQPTRKDYIRAGRSAYNVYRFSYEEGLADRIVKDLSEAVVAGGILPALQIICSTLYERTMATFGGSEWIIKKEDYLALGGPEAQIEEHLDNALLRCAREKLLSLAASFREVDCWKEVLNRLVRLQADGTITTDIVKETELVKIAVTQKCVLDSRESFEEFREG